MVTIGFYCRTFAGKPAKHIWFISGDEIFLL